MHPCYTCRWGAHTQACLDDVVDLLQRQVDVEAAQVFDRFPKAASCVRCVATIH